jgi:uncharacterized protein
MTAPLLTPREVAERLRVSPRTVQNWIRDGKLPAARVSPRVVRVPADAVEALASGASVAAEATACYCPRCGTEVDPADSRTPTERLRALLAEHRDEIIALADERHADNVRIFGSVVRGDAAPGSDIDILVDLRPEASLFDLSGLNGDIDELLGVGVDVVPSKGLKDGTRERILAEALPL